MVENSPCPKEKLGSIVDQLLCCGGQTWPALNKYYGIRLKIIIHACNLWHRYEVSSERSSPCSAIWPHVCLCVSHDQETSERTFHHTGSLLALRMFYYLVQSVGPCHSALMWTNIGFWAGLGRAPLRLQKSCNMTVAQKKWQQCGLFAGEWRYTVRLNFSSSQA